VVRNEAYWREGYPYLDGIQAVVIPELSTRVQSVVSGSNDLTDPIDASAVGSVSGGATILEHRDAYSYAIVMDLTRKPFTDRRVVQAVKLAQNRQRILDAALQGFGSVTGDLPISPNSPLYPPSLGVPEQDLEQARSLLADAGFANGIELELNTSPIAGGITDVAVAFQEIVKPAGIDVKIRQAPEATYWDKTWMRVPMFMDFWLTRYPETVLSLFYVSDASWNESNLNSPELDRLTAQAGATPDRAQQQQLIQQALKIAATQSGVTIPVLGSRLWPHKHTVRGQKPSNTQYLLLEETWIAT
jgi:peptide/nickel transport system substrate-binding protein